MVCQTRAEATRANRCPGCGAPMPTLTVKAWVLCFRCEMWVKVKPSKGKTDGED